MGTLLVLALGFGLIVVVFRYCASGEGDTLGGDMTGYPPDGRKATVKCSRECGDRSVDARHVRTSDDAARAQLGAEVTIFLVLGPLNERERRTAARRHMTLIDVDRLESWMKGTTLSALLVPETGRPGTNRKNAHD
ncbi:hypothetical protein [Streptomyces herbicida]|uniref:hypothetical protein n=1 Tax=Streptomyces herbicida TaxID=3065675 RepID=UPI002930349E|nr:hypothetical protein [Streptomyces sp. NEAU-HV9]